MHFAREQSALALEVAIAECASTVKNLVTGLNATEDGTILVCAEAIERLAAGKD